MREIIVRVTKASFAKRSFCAGAVFSADGLVACAPILRLWARGRSCKAFVRECRARDWQVEWWWA